MPDEINGRKKRLEENFWSLLSHRHPLTWWWWVSGGEKPAELFCDWSRSAFEREALDWRRLATDTVDVNDEEVRHWGRFARWTAARLLAGSYQDAAEPLRHANTVLSLAGLLDPLGEKFPRTALLDRLSEWLPQVSDVTAAGFWRKVRVSSEASRLLSLISRLDGGQSSHSTDSGKRDMARAEVRRFVERVSAVAHDTSDAIPWATSAHVFVETWRSLRHEMSQERPLVVGPHRAGEAVLNPHDIDHFPRVQEVVVPGLKQWWVKLQADGDLVYHGDSRDPSLPMAVVLASWYQRAKMAPLTWALTHASHIEGGLQVLADSLTQLWPEWAPAQSGALTQWSQRRRALAVVDAWLWLEAGDPEQAVAWLGRFVPRGDAVAIIPWMKSHPGYYVMAYRVYDVLSKEPGAGGWDQWAFEHGPVMPDALYLSPVAPRDGAAGGPNQSV